MGLRLRRNKGDGKSNLKAVLGDAEVPTFPASVVKTLETLRSPDSSASHVAAALSVDPGLTVRLLKLVNSAGFSPSRPIDSIDQAVAIAGFGAVESIVLSVGVTASLPTVTADGHDNRRFWLAASRRATVARSFANVLHPATASLSFSAGLLQDMAIPMLVAARADYSPLLAEWNGGGGELHDLEHANFSWSHDEVAGWLCEQWDLPDALAAAIGGHHRVDDPEVPAAVRLAANLREVDSQEVLDRLVAVASNEFGMEPDTVMTLLAEASAEAVEVAAMFT